MLKQDVTYLHDFVSANLSQIHKVLLDLYYTRCSFSKM